MARRMTKNQKDLLINFLESNRFLIEGRARNPSELERYNKKWSELTENLNKVEGARKTVRQWKDTLNDFKVNVKRKARAVHIETTGTGGGPAKVKQLKDSEERLMNLLSPVVVTGIISIPEGGIPANDDQQNYSFMLDDVPATTVSEEMENNNILNIEKAENSPMLDRPLVSEVNVTATSEVVSLSEAIPSATLLNKTVREDNGKKGAKRKRDQLKFDDITKKHEECLKSLAQSNMVLASAVHDLAAKMSKKRRISSSALQLRF